MPTITATNSGSGLDVRNLVDQLVAAEGGPVSSRLDKKEVKIQEGLTGIGTFKGALLDFKATLSPLRKPDAFRAISASSSNPEKFTVSAADNVATGSYEIEISQLAQSQKLKSQSFESEFDNLGSGTITIEHGEVNPDSNRFDLNALVSPTRITIEPGNSSLRDIQLAINASNAGVKASIINDGGGNRLIFNSEETGTENSLRISVSDDDKNDTDAVGLSVLAYNPVATASENSTSVAGKNLEVVAEAKNALFSIDGISISSAKNTISDNIPGVTLQLLKTTDDGFETFKIEQDTSGVKSSIESFVAGYNELASVANTLTGFNADTGQAGPLSGDASIRGIMGQTRRLASSSFNDINRQYTSLASIGINSNLDGTFSIDNSKLDAAIADNPVEVSHLFSAAVSSSDVRIKVVSDKVPTTNGIYNLTINDVPTQGYYLGEPLSSYPDEISSIPRHFSLAVDGVSTSELKLLPQSFNSGEEFAAELQRVINADEYLLREDKSVTVEYLDNQVKITSNTVGSDSSVEIRSMSRFLYFLAGLPMGKGPQGTDLVADVGGSKVIGKEDKLVLAGALNGVVLEVNGKNTGERGDLVVTNGIAAILDGLTESFLDKDGLLDSRIDGYNSRIQDIEKQRRDLVRKLDVSEQRYLKQFSKLDAMLGKMRSTSDFLSEKLSSLPGAKN